MCAGVQAQPRRTRGSGHLKRLRPFPRGCQGPGPACSYCVTVIPAAVNPCLLPTLFTLSAPPLRQPRSPLFSSSLFHREEVETERCPIRPAPGLGGCTPGTGTQKFSGSTLHVLTRAVHRTRPREEAATCIPERPPALGSVHPSPGPSKPGASSLSKPSGRCSPPPALTQWSQHRVLGALICNLHVPHKSRTSCGRAPCLPPVWVTSTRFRVCLLHA